MAAKKANASQPSSGSSATERDHAADGGKPEEAPIAEQDPSLEFWWSFRKEKPVDAKERAKLARKVLEGTLGKHQVAEQYHLLLVHDESQLMRSDADAIYSAISKLKGDKPILLARIIHQN